MLEVCLLAYLPVVHAQLLIYVSCFVSDLTAKALMHYHTMECTTS